MLVGTLLTSCSSTEDAREPQTATGQTESAAETPSDGGAVPLRDHLQAELTIEGQPDWLTTAYGSLWVLLDEAAGIARIDPKTEAVVATIDVGRHPCDGVLAAFGDIWVPSCTDQKLYRVSARAEKVEASIDIPVFKSFSGAGPFGGIAAGAGAVWMVTEGTKGAFDALARIDPRTNKITDTISLGHLGGGVAVANGAVWVTAPEDGVLLRVDPNTRRVGAEVTGLAQPAFIEAGEGSLWVLSGTWSDNADGDGSVTRIDPNSNEIIGSVRVDDSPGGAGDIAVGDGFVWVRTQFTILAKIDPASNTIIERYEGQQSLGGVEVGFGSVWLSDFGFNRVWRVPS